jgi:hypothetical protein
MGSVDCASQSSTKLAPMKPAPPVTKIMFRAQKQEVY